MKSFSLAAAVLVMTCGVAAAATGATNGVVPVPPGYTMTAVTDWVGGVLNVEIAHTLDPATASLVRAKGDAETDIDAQLPDFLQRAVAPLTVDSGHLYDDLLGADPAFSARVRAVALQGKRTDISLKPDFSALVERFVLPLFGDRGVAVPLFPERVTPIRQLLGEVTTRKYTGLLIDARGVLPEAGSTRTASLHPALLPKIWDDRMDLVLDAGRVDPASLARWGVVGYARGLDDDAVVVRAGNLPLRLVARAVFGTKSTDVVISTEGARQLLALADNITLLKQGRVVIVCGNLD
jgi:hypothetical protein